MATGFRCRLILDDFGCACATPRKTNFTFPKPTNQTEVISRCQRNLVLARWLIISVLLAHCDTEAVPLAFPYAPRFQGKRMKTPGKFAAFAIWLGV